MSDWLISIAGTEAGHRLAMVLALISAFLHALFGSLQKGKIDPWISRGAFDAALVVLTLPLALILVPLPQGGEWLLLAGAAVIHFFYKMGVALAYDRGAYTVVYPVIRGTGPLFTLFGAMLIFGESYTMLQWGGVGLLLAGLFGLAYYNMTHIKVARETLVPALLWAIATGGLVALYTTYDAYGIRATADPFTFILWFFVLTALDFPWIALRRWRRMSNPPDPRAVVRLGILGAVIAWGSFGCVMMATRLGSVGEAAVLRETSTVFAAALGWFLLRDPMGPRRLALMVLIALGAIGVQAAG